MIATTSRKIDVSTGLRPFDPRRDFRSVVELIDIAFGDKLTPTAQASLAEMRHLARWGPLLWWLYWPRWFGVMAMSGFVWVEEGRVVGNVSLRRSSGANAFIGNVAVHPDWRGRGIASQLMKAALDEPNARRGHWIGLEVRADNLAARQLYEQLGFQEIGRTVCMLRPAGLPIGNLPVHPLLRRGRRRDSTALIHLMHAIVPEPHRQLLELSDVDYQLGWQRVLDCWFDGRREFWWVFEEKESLCGAVRALQERGRRPNRLEILIAPEHSGHLEDVLVRRGVTSLCSVSDKMIEVVLLPSSNLLLEALEEMGFQRACVLIQMRQL